MTFSECDTGVTGQAIADRLLSHLNAWRLPASHMIEESRPRTAGRQQHRGNAPSASTSEYFRRQLTIPALDHLISKVSDRFSSRLTATLSQIMLLLPSSVAES